MRLGLAYFEHDIRFRPQLLRIVDDLDTRVAIGLVAELGSSTGPCFHANFKPEFLNTTRRFRGQGHTLLACVHFLRNANSHSQFSPVGTPACGTPLTAQRPSGY